MRRFIADRIATEYISGLRDRSHHYGLKLWMENYGHWGYPGEFLNYGGASDEVSGEYWVTKPQRGEVEVRCASSAAHIYGKQRVSAESFTDSGTTFNTQPDKLKARGDWAMCQGINHYVLHVYLHQPDDRKPGITAWFGTDFNRNNTWFKPTYAPAFESEFKTLSDWRENGNPGIKYYSGAAVYENTFTYKPKKKERAKDVCLDLGSVKGMATVRINGVELPTLWTSPYRQSVTPYLKKGKNKVEIEVVNCWWNRLAGDAKPGSKPVTWTTNRIVNVKSKLLPSGLLGPVSLVVAE